jgi:hypothetical protein
MATHVEGLAAAARCADAAIERARRYWTLAELVRWFYDDATMPGTVEWDECVLQTYWDTHTWRGVFTAWDECGRPEYDPSVWGRDDWDPDSRRAAQGNARLDAVGEMVFNAFPDAIERAARELGWTVVSGADCMDGWYPEGALALDPEGLEVASGRWYVNVLIPPAVSSVA